VLLLENIHSDAVTAFAKEGYNVETVKGLCLKKNCERIKDVSILGIKTQISKKYLIRHLSFTLNFHRNKSGKFARV
jgi:D-3-phosphoglycerate dehydrogenase